MATNDFTDPSSKGQKLFTQGKKEELVEKQNSTILWGIFI
jgi:hypothetical protein